MIDVETWSCLLLINFRLMLELFINYKSSYKLFHLRDKANIEIVKFLLITFQSLNSIL